MDIGEILKERKILRESIWGLIAKFEEDTRCVITEIRIRRANVQNVELKVTNKLTNVIIRAELP